MAFGVTNTGFVRKRLDQILDDLNSGVKGVFGSDALVGPEDPLGQINAIVAEQLSILWQGAELTYNSISPNRAIGQQLDDTAAYSGIIRNAATNSRVTATVTGDVGTSVIAGEISVVSTDYANMFVNDANFVIPASGSIDVQFSAIDTGPIPVNAGTIGTIETPISGISSVDNAAQGVAGADRESDPGLRIRRRRSVARASGYGVDSIYAAVGDISGVSDLNILVNESEITDANGLPEHSFMVVVTGGDDTEIAKAIYSKKGIGITAHGSTIVQVADVVGVNHPVGLHRPTPVIISVRLAVTALQGISATAESDIKQAIVDYSNGDLVDNRGFFSGDDVIFFELYTPINTIDNISVSSLEISFETDDFGNMIWITSDVPISDLEISSFSVSNIGIAIQ